MLLDVELPSRELVVFFVPFLTATEKQAGLPFEVHRQIALYKDADPKVTKKIYDLWAPYHF